MTSTRSPCSTAGRFGRSRARPAQLDDLARRLANAPELQEIRQGSPEFFAQQWTPAAQEILSRARTEMDAVLAQAEADFLRLRLAVVKAWADERRKS